MCPDCLVELVDDLDATVRCANCGRDWPAWMQSCPHCLSELHHDPERMAEAAGRILAAGMHLPRPPGQGPFAAGPECTLLRVGPRSGLVFVGPEGLLEAGVRSRDRAARPPLSCDDFDGTRIFGMSRYEAAPHALVAVGGGGTPLATFLRTGSVLDAAIDVRDETSAPVGRLVPSTERDGLDLVETGGGTVAYCSRIDHRSDDWVDDQWSLQVVTGRLPLEDLAAVAMVLAAKVLLGRASPERVGGPSARMEDETDFP